MVGEPSHVKQLSLIHVCKIGLRFGDRPHVKHSSHAPSDSPVTAACTTQKLLLMSMKLLYRGKTPHLQASRHLYEI